MTQEIKYITQSTVLERENWTKSGICKFLKEPDKYVKNPHYSKAPQMKLYDLSRVENIECLKTFQKWAEKSKLRREKSKANWNNSKIAIEKAREEKAKQYELDQLKPFIELYNKNYCILDTETTGLGSTAEVVEISVIDRNNNILFNSLIKPVKPVPADATAVNHITNGQLQNCKSYLYYHNQLKEVLKRYETVIIFNAAYDKRILKQSTDLYSLKQLQFRTDCLMLLYAEYWGEWSNYHRAYKNQSLINACTQRGVDISDLNTHRALSDCTAANRLLTNLVKRDMK